VNLLCRKQKTHSSRWKKRESRRIILSTLKKHPMIEISKATGFIIGILGIGILVFILGFSRFSGTVIGIIAVIDFLILYHLFWALMDRLLKIRFRYMKLFVVK